MKVFIAKRVQSCPHRWAGECGFPAGAAPSSWSRSSHSVADENQPQTQRALGSQGGRGEDARRCVGGAAGEAGEMESGRSSPWRNGETSSGHGVPDDRLWSPFICRGGEPGGRRKAVERVGKCFLPGGIQEKYSSKDPAFLPLPVCSLTFLFSLWLVKLIW